MSPESPALHQCNQKSQILAVNPDAFLRLKKSVTDLSPPVLHSLRPLPPCSCDSMTWQSTCKLDERTTTPHEKFVMLDHLRPHYAKNFHCIGTRCEDNCCRGWEVFIDKSTYQRYQSLPALRPIMDERFVRLNDAPSDDRYALIRDVSSSVCPFLSQDRLCGLQREYGDAYLSLTCAAYPRIPRRIDGLLEQPLSLSCPEAARLVLLNPQLIPDDPTVAGDRRYARFLAMADRTSLINETPIRFFWDIREFILLLLRDRTYSLSQRLFLLGIFCRRLNELISSHQVGLMPKLLHDYAEIAATGNLRSAMDSIAVQPTAQVKMVLEVIVRHLAQSDPRLYRVHECLQEFMQGINHEPAASLESCTRGYVDAYTRYFAPFMEEHPYLLENYVVNHVFRTRFPFGLKSGNDFDDPLHEYVLLCVEFALIKGLLIGVAGCHRETFSAHHVVKVAHTFARAFEHTMGVREVMNWQGLAGTESMAALLKN